MANFAGEAVCVRFECFYRQPGGLLLDIRKPRKGSMWCTHTRHWDAFMAPLMPRACDEQSTSCQCPPPEPSATSTWPANSGHPLPTPTPELSSPPSTSPSRAAVPPPAPPPSPELSPPRPHSHCSTAGHLLSTNYLAAFIKPVFGESLVIPMPSDQPSPAFPCRNPAICARHPRQGPHCMPQINSTV